MLNPLMCDSEELRAPVGAKRFFLARVPDVKIEGPISPIKEELKGYLTGRNVLCL